MTLIILSHGIDADDVFAGEVVIDHLAGDRFPGLVGALAAFGRRFDTNTWLRFVVAVWSIA